MSKYVIDGTTLINIADAIREKSGAIQKELIFDETTETHLVWGGGSGAIWDILDEVSLLKVGDTCIVTLDNVKYTTVVFTNIYGYMCLGNYGLSTYDDVGEEHINDMPFLIEYSPQDTGTGLLEWYHEISITYPDENEHTIKIEKIIGTIEPIPVKNFATEINNLPNAGGSLPLYPEEGQIECTIRYTSNATSSSTRYSTLDITGYKINDQGFIEGFMEAIPLSSNGGDSGTIALTVLRNSILEFYNNANWGFGGEPEVDITAVYIDGFQEANVLNSMMTQQSGMEIQYLALPLLTSGGIPYHEIIIDVNCFISSQM